MESEAWVFAAFVLMALVHIGLVLYWRQRTANPSGEAAPRRPGETAPTAVRDDEGETAWCPDCGEPNHPQYRYCRECVSELGGGRISSASESDSRGVF